MAEIIRISISEASRLFGINPQTLRRAIKQEELTYVVVRGRYQLNFESILKWSQNSTILQNKMAQKGIGQFVSRWKIGNRLYSPNPKSVRLKKQPKSSRKTIDSPVPPSRFVLPRKFQKKSAPPTSTSPAVPYVENTPNSNNSTPLL